jgi:hypothetical protein
MENLQVPALSLLPTTPRIGNTKQEEFVIFVGSLHNASFFRPDGKKLPFIKGLLKTNTVEDIKYLDEEIASGNPYVKRASPEEVSQAEALFDPLGALRKKIEKDVGAELYEQLRAKLSNSFGITVDKIDEIMSSQAPLDAGTSTQMGAVPSGSRVPEHLKRRSGT